MGRKNRPNPFDLSLPAIASERRDRPASASSFSAYLSSTTLVGGSSKRGSEEPVSERLPKRRKLPPVSRYRPDDGIEAVDETDEFVLPGENDEEDDDDDPDGIPIRVLTNFTIFDPEHSNEMVSLEAFYTDDGLDRAFSAVGYVSVYRPDEHADDDEDEEGPLTFLRIGAVMTWSMNLIKKDDPVYIQTQYAYYILDRPSEGYEETFKAFITPRTLAQTLFTSVLQEPSLSLSTFVEHLANTVDMFGRTWLKSDFQEYVVEIDELLGELDGDPHISQGDASSLKRSSLIRTHVLGKSSQGRKQRNKKPNTSHQAMHNRQIPANRLIGNPDLAAAHQDNRNPTHITPRIAALAYGLVREQMQVVGAPFPSTAKEAWARNARKRKAWVRDLVLLARIRHPRVVWQVGDKVRLGSKYLKRIVVEKVEYKPGDVVLVQVPNHPFWNGNPKFQDIEFEVADIFWFGRIIWLDHDDNAHGVHVQWFEHASATLMQDLANPQELFLTNIHDSQKFTDLVGKVTVKWNPPLDEPIPPDEFFCRQMYNYETSAWSSIPPEYATIINDQPPGDNCPVCVRETEKGWDESCVPLKDKETGCVTGYSYMGQRYHVHDFVLYYGDAASDVANIGYVVGVSPTPQGGKAHGFVKVRKVGRMVDLSHLFPFTRYSPLKDEREVYMTKETARIPIDQVFSVVHVPCLEALGEKMTREDWLRHSPYHFYMQYEFPTLTPTDLKQRRKIDLEEYGVCDVCWGDKLVEMKRARRFLLAVKQEEEVMPTLDLFAGVGAFSQGLVEGSGCMKVTHAVELSPSAALTIERNHPDVVVFNQCANVMLRQFIKTWEGHPTTTVRQLHNSEPIPDVPKKGFIKAIVAGFPCQGHSKLNMHQNSDDVRNNLMFTTVSYVDAIRPDFVFFENVPNFLEFKLGASQAGAHRVVGGVEHGGIKIVVRALLDMGYQLRFGKLQAAHYGTPQDRLRLILVGAREGKPLPNLPHPSHGFQSESIAKSPKMNLPYGRDGNTMGVLPEIRLLRGTAPNPPVTIEDAISDLPRFDWSVHSSGAPARPRKDEYGRVIPLVSCVKDRQTKWWGVESSEYHTSPQTRYQLESRAASTRVRQQFTRLFDLDVAGRVIKIPLKAGADYRSLRPEDRSWGDENPMSSAAKQNHRAPIFGRLNSKGLFPTIVTNVGPTAKQSRVLNPWCKRIVTIREVARAQGFPDSFQFVALKNRVQTIHVQIGNAVPLQLARAVGRELREALLKGWEGKSSRRKRGKAAVAPPVPLIPPPEEDDDDIYV